MISFETKGDFSKTEAFLKRIGGGDIFQTLDRFGREGVSALAAATPMDTGLTATSWDYTIVRSRGSYSIVWTNSHVNNGTPIAVLLQYGHATGTGGYVQGRDYINPAIKPIFDRIANEAWKAVTKR